MGWHTNYEVEFDEFVDWEDAHVTRVFDSLSFDVTHLYLRDLAKTRVMLCVYSHTPVEDVLGALKVLYHVPMRFRVYDNGEAWVAYAP